MRRAGCVPHGFVAGADVDEVAELVVHVPGAPAVDEKVEADCAGYPPGAALQKNPRNEVDYLVFKRKVRIGLDTNFFFVTTVFKFVFPPNFRPRIGSYPNLVSYLVNLVSYLVMCASQPCILPCSPRILPCTAYFPPTLHTPTSYPTS